MRTTTIVDSIQNRYRSLLHQTFALLRHSPEILETQTIVEELPPGPLITEVDEGQ
jgi:hypothetical protein